MNNHRLRHLLRSILFASALPLAGFGAACGGSSLNDSHGDTRTNAGANNAGAALIIAGAGSQAGASDGGAAGTGTGGSTAGTGGSTAGTGGSTAGAGSTAGGGSSGESGSAGAGVAGANNETCQGHPVTSCTSFTVVLPLTCVGAGQAAVGTQLSQTTCKSICSVPFVFGCQVTAATSSDVTVRCDSGCPAGAPPTQ